MRTDVLHVDDYPVISFVSTGVTPSVDGFQVQGRLTLAGQTRDVSCDVRAAVGTDTLRATGEFSVKQTDYGIDRKSTRLNSSHGYISYAVFCLKKKKKQE